MHTVVHNNKKQSILRSSHLKHIPNFLQYATCKENLIVQLLCIETSVFKIRAEKQVTSNATREVIWQTFVILERNFRNS